jgi:hypothetical protein
MTRSLPGVGTCGFSTFAGLWVGVVLLAHVAELLLRGGGVPAVAAFIGGAMMVGFTLIGLLGPGTNGVALEKSSDQQPCERGRLIR